MSGVVCTGLRRLSGRGCGHVRVMARPGLCLRSRPGSGAMLSTSSRSHSRGPAGGAKQCWSIGDRRDVVQAVCEQKGVGNQPPRHRTERGSEPVCGLRRGCSPGAGMVAWLAFQPPSALRPRRRASASTNPNVQVCSRRPGREHQIVLRWEPPVGGRLRHAGLGGHHLVDADRTDTTAYERLVRRPRCALERNTCGRRCRAVRSSVPGARSSASASQTDVAVRLELRAGDQRSTLRNPASISAWSMKES
jgi:hypothetical protein